VSLPFDGNRVGAAAQIGHTVQFYETRSRRGVGPGVAISRNLARAMSGGIAVASRVRVGSTFTLTLRCP
jgi:signal transduction histidine kinase